MTGALGRSLRVGEALRAAVGALAAAGCESPRLDAEVLLAASAGVSRAGLIADPRRALDDAAAARFEEWVARRAAREPVAYILGRKEFRALTLAVDPRVLVPRPETEHLVEASLALPPGARVVDVGTGSGAVALALKHERADLTVMGTDASAAAVEVARANAARLGLDVEFVVCDLLDAVTGHVDAVLSNPPYVRADETLAPEIALHEPAEALFAGADGLDAIRRLIPAAAGADFLALEVGAGQAPAVAGLMRAAAWPAVTRTRDLAGIERVVVGRR